MAPTPPNYQELLAVCREYTIKEQGDTNYEVARIWVDLHWSDSWKVAGAVRIFEETWNRAFYGRFGIFSMDHLVATINRNRTPLESFRELEIDQWSTRHEDLVGHLWTEMFESLRPMGRDVRLFVATSKALHILAPSFFMPFDAAILNTFTPNIDHPGRYIRFQSVMSEFAVHVLDTYVTENGGDRTAPVLESHKKGESHEGSD